MGSRINAQLVLPGGLAQTASDTEKPGIFPQVRPCPLHARTTGEARGSAVSHGHRGRQLAWPDAGR